MINSSQSPTMSTKDDQLCDIYLDYIFEHILIHIKSSEVQGLNLCCASICSAGLMFIPNNDILKEKYAHFISLLPNHGQAKEDIENTDYQIRNYVNLFSRFLHDILPENQYAMFYSGQACIRVGLYTKAHYYMNKAYLITPNQLEIRLTLGYLLLLFIPDREQAGLNLLIDALDTLPTNPNIVAAFAKIFTQRDLDSYDFGIELALRLAKAILTDLEPKSLKEKVVKYD